MTIEPSGVRSRNFRNQLIAWQDIADIRILSLRGSKGLVFEVLDPDKYPLGNRALLAIADSLKRTLGATNYNVPLFTVQGRTAEIYETVLSYWNAHRSPPLEPTAERTA